MLLELRIRDLALISSLDLDFSDCQAGLVVFTGETGAGKSVILQAVRLLTGGKASAALVRSGCAQALLEASFDISRQPEIGDLLREHGLDSGGDCILRRTVSGEGRSRFFVNDRLATARLAAQLGGLLVNIASQHDQQLLLRSASHADFLDGHAGLLEQRGLHSRLFARRQGILQQLERLRGQERDKEQRRAFLSFQLKEIRQAGLSPGEDARLAKERDLLKASATLTELAGRSHQLLQEPVRGQLAAGRKQLEQAATIDPQLKELAARLSSACFEIEDIEAGLDAYLSALPRDQSRLDEIAARLALIRQLQRKYGATVEEVIACGEGIAAELRALEHLDQEIATLEQDLAKAEAELRRQAAELSAARTKAGARLSQAMQAELAPLHFKQALFETAVQPDEACLGPAGWDKVEFLFSANQGEPLKPLTEVVSGGELSRLMLAMKCVFTRQDRVETVILDEIDAGIGGEAASAVARKIRGLAGGRQVFCITHLPQIAACGSAHFLVEKAVEGSRACTVIRRLPPEERAAELARMLGGDSPTSQTLALAKELLEAHALQQQPD